MFEITVLETVKGCTLFRLGWLRTVHLTDKEAAWLHAELVDDDVITASAEFMAHGQLKLLVDGKQVKVTW